MKKEMKQYPLRLEKERLEKLREEAKGLGISLNSLIKLKIEGKLNKNNINNAGYNKKIEEDN